MTQRIKVPTALAENWNLVPRTHECLKLHFQRIQYLLWLLEFPGTQVVHIYMLKNTCKNKNIDKKILKTLRKKKCVIQQRLNIPAFKLALCNGKVYFPNGQ